MSEIKKKIIVAVDGLAGSGKSITSREVAKQLDYKWVSSGWMYRAIALKVKNMGGDMISLDDISKHEPNLVSMMKDTDIQIINQSVFLDGVDVTGCLEAHDISLWTSSISQLQGIRDEATRRLRRYKKCQGLIMDGRDIGSVVFPEAELKIFMIASLLVRAKRRKFEWKGANTSIASIKRDIEARDRKDKHRIVAPMIEVEDAFKIDTTSMTLLDQINTVRELIIERVKK